MSLLNAPCCLLECKSGFAFWRLESVNLTHQNAGPYFVRISKPPENCSSSSKSGTPLTGHIILAVPPLTRLPQTVQLQWGLADNAVGAYPTTALVEATRFWRLRQMNAV